MLTRSCRSRVPCVLLAKRAAGGRFNDTMDAWRTRRAEKLSAEREKIRSALARGEWPAVRESAIEPPTWHLVDARDQVIGRLATQIAPILMGKHKPTYEPHRHEHGDFVVVVNAQRMVFTGRRMRQKLYRWHTGYPGGLRERTARDQAARNPAHLLRWAVLGMLPKNKLRVVYANRLKIFSGAAHLHEDEIGDKRSIV